MGAELDLDDVAATSPLAMRELADLRAEVGRLKNDTQKIESVLEARAEAAEARVRVLRNILEQFAATERETAKRYGGRLAFDLTMFHYYARKARAALAERKAGGEK